MTQKLTILFDLDGTLVDTAPDLMGAHNHVMKKFGFHQKKLGDIKHLAGRGAWIMMQRSFREEITDEKLKKEMVKEFIDHYAKNIDKRSVPIKGVVNLNIQPKDLHDVVFELLNENAVSFIGIQNKDMNTLVCSVTKDINHKFKAGDLVKNIAIKLGFNGGGLPHMAITNFKNKELLEKAINIGFELIKDQA